MELEVVRPSLGVRERKSSRIDKDMLIQLSLPSHRKHLTFQFQPATAQPLTCTQCVAEMVAAPHHERPVSQRRDLSLFLDVSPQ